jgi:ribonuclease P/MRP protein subunit POP5
MVRVKHRYLLVNILYPSEVSPQLQKEGPHSPDIIKFHRPSPTELNQGLLRRTIIDSIKSLYGENGIAYAGGSSLQSES